jgi:hypothetical protein
MFVVLVAVGGSNSSTCGAHGELCHGPGAPSDPLTFVVFLAVLALAFVLVSVTNIVREHPPDPHQHGRPKPPPKRPATGRTTPKKTHDVHTTADHYEHLAEVTGRYQRPFAWMSFRTITGKLTIAAWISRWWASGSYMRRRLVVSTFLACVTFAAIWIALYLIIR